MDGSRRGKKKGGRRGKNKARKKQQQASSAAASAAPPAGRSNASASVGGGHATSLPKPPSRPFNMGPSVGTSGAEAAAGVHVLREAFKLPVTNHFFIATLKEIPAGCADENGETDTETCYRLRCYHPNTSEESVVEIALAEAEKLFKRAGVDDSSALKPKDRLHLLLEAMKPRLDLRWQRAFARRNEAAATRASQPQALPHTQPPSPPPQELQLADRPARGFTAAAKSADGKPGAASTSASSKYSATDEFKERGNARFRVESYHEAAREYTRAVDGAPDHPVYLLNRAAALLELGQWEDCIADSKACIARLRELERKGLLTVGEEADADALDRAAASIAQRDYQAQPQMLIAKAYLRMGRAFNGLGKKNRALACFILSCKEHDTNKARQMIQNIRSDLHGGNAQAAAAAEVGVGGPGVPSPPMMAAPDTTDIEDILQNHSLKRYREPFQFDCTMCGECCRTSDMIMITPVDLFQMTRSPNMRLRGVTTTHELRKHKAFSGALQFTIKGANMPVCYLRPIKSSSGRCLFSYPLYKFKERGLGYEAVFRSGLLDEYKPVDPSEYNLTEEEEYEALEAGNDDDDDDYDDAEDGNANVDGNVDGEEADEEEDDDSAGGALEDEDGYDSALAEELGLEDKVRQQQDQQELQERKKRDREHQAKQEASTVKPSEAAECGHGDPDTSLDGPEDFGDTAHSSGSPSRGPLTAQQRAQAEAIGRESREIFNSYGRQALGCMFGPSHMPTMCASYPIATELSWADFWHIHDPHHAARHTVAPRRMRAAPESAAMQASANDQPDANEDEEEAGTWLEAEKYVVVRSSACEGFFPRGAKRTELPSGARGVQNEDGEMNAEDSANRRSARSFAQGRAAPSADAEEDDDDDDDDDDDGDDDGPGNPERKSCEPPEYDSEEEEEKLEDRTEAGNTDDEKEEEEDYEFHHPSLEDHEDDEEDPDSTIETFVTGTSNLRERWQHTDWFIALIRRIEGMMPPRAAKDKKLRQKIAEVLAAIWFNFDTLATARRRPFKTVQRLKRDLETLSVDVMRVARQVADETTGFRQGASSEDAANENSVADEFMNVIQRLNL